MSAARLARLLAGVSASWRSAAYAFRASSWCLFAIGPYNWPVSSSASKHINRAGRLRMSAARLARLLAGVSVTALAALPFQPAQAQSQVFACVSSHGSVAALGTDPSLTCNNKDTLLVWNVVGPQGPAGAPGTQGPIGPIGPAGVHGPARRGRSAGCDRPARPARRARTPGRDGCDRPARRPGRHGSARRTRHPWSARRGWTAGRDRCDGPAPP